MLHACINQVFHPAEAIVRMCLHLRFEHVRFLSKVHERTVTIQKCRKLENLFRSREAEHPDALSTTFCLAEPHRSQGRYDKAETLFKQAPEIWYLHTLSNMHDQISTSPMEGRNTASDNTGNTRHHYGRISLEESTDSS
jgi:hypothetical protein